MTLDGVTYEHNATSADLNATRDALAAILAGNPKADVTTEPDGVIRLTGKILGDSYAVAFDTNSTGGVLITGSSGRGSFTEGATGLTVRAITSAEYFTGVDPGEGSGIALSPEDGNFSLDSSLDQRIEGADATIGEFTGRELGKTYFFRIRALGQEGDATHLPSEWTEPVTFSMPAPPKPLEFNATDEKASLP